MNICEQNASGRRCLAALLTLLFCTAAAQAQPTGAVIGTSSNGTVAGVHGDNTSTGTGPAVGVRGSTQSTTSSVAAIIGVVVPTSPGGFSAGVRGVNNGTGGLGIGVWGSQAGSGWGVYGVTPNGLGVYGNSTASGYGVFGNSTGGNGVYGTSNSATAAGIYATNSNISSGSGIALEVAGEIKVSGAHRAAFQHTAIPGNITSNYTTIDNPMTNGDANAILVVTPVLLPPNNQYASFPIGVWYSTISAKWTIFNQLSSAFPPNAAFNVLVIKR
jgi:hypothetical protein